jgi:hypothetical protein
MSELDKDFDIVAAQINAKFEEAGKAMREANELMEKAGVKTMFIHPDAGPSSYDIEEEEVESQEEMRYKLDISPVFKELRRAGWSTSSMRC